MDHFCTKASFASALLSALFVILLPTSAEAYPWMIRHEYTACIQCHVDPAGGGLLTEYGRAQGETLLRMRYGSDASEPGKVKDFLWGLFATPEWLLLGGSVRPAVLAVDVDGAPVSTTLILMEADLRAGVRAGGFRASVSAGVINTDASLASIAGLFVSREHWLGYAWDDDAFLVRAGRMNVPFGIRQIEHPLWVRAVTRTDINDGQEHGIAFDYTGPLLRGSVMAILGNYQVAPDAYRERGYAGFVEFSPISTFAVGISSLVTHAQKDLVLGVPNTRQAHGAFLRAAPVRSVVIMAEGDAIANTTSPTVLASSLGFASMLQVDVEPLQGLHLIATGESLSPGGAAPASSFGAWGSVHWFFLPHADARVDFSYRSMAEGTVVIPVMSYLAQIHAYL